MGMDKNLEIGDFSIYHLAGFSGVLGFCKGCFDDRLLALNTLKRAPCTYDEMSANYRLVSWWFRIVLSA